MRNTVKPGALVSDILFIFRVLQLLSSGKDASQQDSSGYEPLVGIATGTNVYSVQLLWFESKESLVSSTVKIFNIQWFDFP